MEDVHILIPSVTNKPIVSEIIRTFGGDVKIKVLHLTDIVVNNYSSEKLIGELKAQIEESISDWFDRYYNDNSKVYLILTGGILQSVIAVSKLDKLGVKYDFLVYERRVRKYVCITREGNVNTDFLMEYIYTE